MSELSRSVESLDDPAPSFPNVQEVVSPGRGTGTQLREGLPPNYRMRADAHYVDQLVAPLTRPAAGAAKPAGASPSEPKAPNLSPIDSELASALSAVLSSTALLAETTPRLTRSVTIDMIRAEIHRASCTLRAASVIRYGVPEERRLVSPRQVLHRVAEIVGPDVRLRGISLNTNLDADGAMSIDEELLASTFAAVVLMLAGALSRVDGASLALTATAESSGRVTLAVEQESVVVPEAWFTALTPAAIEGPGGHQLVPLVALRQVVEACGGRLAASRLPHGTRVAVEMPLITRR